MSSYVSKVLMPDEHIVYAATLHWIIYTQGLILTAFGGLLGFLSRPTMSTMFGERLGMLFTKPICMVAMIIILVGIVLLVGAYIRQISTELVVTNKRLIAKYGYFSFTTFEILVNRITGANFDQTLTGRVFGYGTVLVHGAGGEISPIDLVDNPQLFYRALVSVLRA